MGVVNMEEHLDFISNGYSYLTATLYVYCDQCGSFDVRTTLSFRKWLLIMGAAGSVAAAILATFLRGEVIWLPLSAGVCVLCFTLLWGEKNYRCRKCRARPTTRYNTRRYPPGTNAVDVPEASLQKRYISYWPDMCDLDEVLKPPEPDRD